MREYLEYNNTDDKRLIMICISEEAKTMRYSSTDIRREFMGLPIIRQFKSFKGTKIYLSEIIKICSIRKLAESGSFNLSNYSKYFKTVKEYNLFRRCNND